MPPRCESAWPGACCCRGRRSTGPGAHLLHYPIAGGSLINFLAVVDEPQQWTVPAWRQTASPGAHLKPFASWHPAVTQMLEAMPQSPRWGLFTLPRLRRWNCGPIVLLGDAAHAMLPRQGQGANQAIEDAADLAAELHAAPDIMTALRRYQHRRRARTRQVQAASWSASAALHLPDGPAAQSRNAYLARLPSTWPGSRPQCPRRGPRQYGTCRRCRSPHQLASLPAVHLKRILMPSGRIHAPDRGQGKIEDRG